MALTMICDNPSCRKIASSPNAAWFEVRTTSPAVGSVSWRTAQIAAGTYCSLRCLSGQVEEAMTVAAASYASSMVNWRETMLATSSGDLR